MTKWIANALALIATAITLAIAAPAKAGTYEEACIGFWTATIAYVSAPESYKDKARAELASRYGSDWESRTNDFTLGAQRILIAEWLARPIWNGNGWNKYQWDESNTDCS